MLSQVLWWMPTNLRQYCQMIDFGSKSKATFETVSMFYDQLSYLPAAILSVARFGPKIKRPTEPPAHILSLWRILMQIQHFWAVFENYFKASRKLVYPAADSQCQLKIKFAARFIIIQGQVQNLQHSLINHQNHNVCLQSLQHCTNLKLSLHATTRTAKATVLSPILQMPE